jgi:hypothetical protein
VRCREPLAPIGHWRALARRPNFESDSVLMTAGSEMDRPYTSREKSRITAGAVASLVIVGWMIVLAIVFLSVR